MQEQRDGKPQRLNPIIFEPMVMSILLARPKGYGKLKTDSTKFTGKQAAQWQAAILDSQELSSEFLNI